MEVQELQKVNRTREEQEEEFREFIAPYANPGCELCFGRGYSGWHVILEQLLPCRCALKNIYKAEREKYEKNIKPS